MISFIEAVKQIEEILLCQQEAKRLIKYIIKSDSYCINAYIDEAQFNEIKLLALKMSVDDMPFSRLVNMKSFWDDDFIINKYTLDPRPETEGIIDISKKLFHTQNKIDILDIGTGSGCIILSLLKEFPSSKGIATDINPKTIQIAKINANRLCLNNRIKFITTSWTKGINKKFDLIVSNPPYISKRAILPNNVIKYDPSIALFSNNDGLLSYEKIIPCVYCLIKKNGKIIFEIGEEQAKHISYIAKQYFNNVIIQKDLSLKDRYIILS